MKQFGDDIRPDDKVLREAKDRFERCETWEQNSRTAFLSDLKFANADSVNGWQWPDTMRNSRTLDQKPCLTINKTRQHNLMIMNDARKHKPGIAYRPTGNGATKEAADVLMDLARHVEQQSNATTAYDTATKFQVTAGIGYIRVVTDYAGDDSFNQEIFIRRVNNPLSVYMDPDAKEADKSDSRFAFVFDDLDKKLFNELYPKFKDKVSEAALGVRGPWIDDKHVRVCEYFRVVKKPDLLLRPRSGEIIRASDLKGQLRDDIVNDPETQSREITKDAIEWFLLAGNSVINKGVWLGKWIPIVPVIGEETVIDGMLDRKGHTRALLDPQRMYNYFGSSSVEHIALQGKTPFIATAESIEDYETMWNTANTVNHSVLIYNGKDDAGQPIPPPQRAVSPEMSQGYLMGMKVASEDIQSVSGQYDAQMGQQGNERTGKAIEQRQRQGDTATYHYIDELGTAVRQVGRICLDLFPKIYDTRRVIAIKAENGESYEVEIDPQAKQAWLLKQAKTAATVRRVLFNPDVGKYEVVADSGPSYATQREEAFNAFTLILTQAPQLASLIGDILFRVMDIPLAEEAADRIKRMVPPQALGTGPSQGEQILQLKVEQLTGALQAAMEKLAEDNLKLKGKDQLRDIDVYNALTQRLKVVGEQQMSEQDMKTLVANTLHEVLGMDLDSVVGASAPGLDSAAAVGAGSGMGALNNKPVEPFPGAKMGPDGRWYGKDYSQTPGYRPVA